MVWRALLEIAEQVHPQITGVALQRACGPAASELVTGGMLVTIADAATVPPATSWDDDNDAFEHGYERDDIEPPGSRVRVVRPAYDPCTYRLDLGRFLRAVAAALGVRRAAPPTEMIADSLWWLGEATTGDRSPTFFLARRLYARDNLVKVLAELTAILHHEPLIVLTTAQSQPGVPVPRGVCFISLHDCAWLERGDIRLDHRLIADSARAALSTAETTDEFWHSPTYDTVRLRGLEFRLTRPRREIVRKLHQASKTHQPWVPGKHLLQDPTKRMVDTFKSLKPGWRLLIESDARGNYRLKV